MAHREENKEGAAVPRFGAWDQKGGGEFNGYSVVFTQAREKRKQTKVEVPSTNLNTQHEFGPPQEAKNFHGPRPRAHHNNRHRRSHSHPKVAPFDSSQLHSHGPTPSSKDESNKGMKKKLLQYCGGCAGH